MLVGIISLQSSLTSQIPPVTPELWPLNGPKTELAVCALQVEYPAPHNVITIIYHKYDRCILCQFGTLVGI